MTTLLFDNPFEADRLNAAHDFIPEWDIASSGSNIVGAIRRNLRMASEADKPDPRMKVQVLLGPSGYGKTHFVGRVLHEEADKVCLVFVPQASVMRGSVANVQWNAVETLFENSRDSVPLIQQFLARILQRSFAAFVDQLSSALRSKHQSLRQRVESDWRLVLEMTRGISDPRPFLALADSFAKRHPSLSVTVLRALILGLSPFSDEARKWLRGELLMPDRYDVLQLPESPPEALHVLQAVATLLRQLKIPLLICLDQIEMLLAKQPEQVLVLTTNLMGWLQEVPNCAFVMTGLTDKWKEMQGKFNAFMHRVEVLQISELSPSDAAEMVRRRMNSWEGKNGQGDGWPFDLPSVQRFAERKLVGARPLIQICKEYFKTWLASDRKTPIYLAPAESSVSLEPSGVPDSPNTASAPVPPRMRPVEERFVDAWQKELDAVRTKGKPAEHLQEAELWEGVKRALQIGFQAPSNTYGVTIRKIVHQAIKAAPSDARPSAEIKCSAGDMAFDILVGVSKRDSGPAFAAYVKALEQALGGNVKGAVLLWPSQELRVGKTSKAFVAYRDLVNKKVVRHFGLDEEADTFVHLECLRQMLYLAESGNLLLGDKQLSEPECRKLIIETGVLKGLKLYGFLFASWPGVEIPVAKPAETSELPTNGPPTPRPNVNAPQASRAPASPTPSVAPAMAAPKQPLHEERRTQEPTAWAKAMLGSVVDRLTRLGQGVRPLGVDMGPTFARFKLEPEDDADPSKIRKRAEMLKLHLKLQSLPVVGVQPGYISIDIPRPDPQIVALTPLLTRPPTELAPKPSFPVGVDVGGAAHWLDLSDPSTCHLLVAGMTGSGKSEFLKMMIAALAMRFDPQSMQFVLIDPKQVTFNLPGESPYLRRPVATDLSEAIPIMQECVGEMERRYELLRKLNLENIDQLPEDKAEPRIVILLDEFADLMFDRESKKELERFVQRIGNKARAAGIHLVLATQRPDANVVNPQIRNALNRISLKVSSERDSNIVLECPDAAHLAGKGDLLWKQGAGLLRVQSPFVPKNELASALRII